MTCEFSNIVITPGSLIFETKEGSAFVPPYRNLHFKKAGGAGTLSPNWKVELSEDWLSVSPTSSDAPEVVRVSVKSLGMKAGEYEARITPTSRNKITITPPFVDVTLIVKAKPESKPEEPEPEHPTKPVEPEQPEEPKPLPVKPEEPKEPVQEPPTLSSYNWFRRMYEFIRQLFGLWR